MPDAVWPALIETAPKGHFEVRAPGVGLWSDGPAGGALLVPGSSVGQFRQLNRRWTVILPAGAWGEVQSAKRDRVVAVEYREVLFQLHPREMVGAPEREATREAQAAFLAVVAPSDGVFYTRPALGAQPFVAVGGRVRTGQTVGLVEVMKTFGQIVYGGPGFPEESEVLEILCADGDEIRSGQPLIVVR